MSISGKKLGFAVGGVLIVGNYAWTASEEGDVLDRTVGSDRGKARSDLGVDDTKISAKLYLDLVSGEYLLVRRGTELTNLELYGDIDAASPLFAFPEALVTRSSLGGEVRGRMEVNVEIVAQGDFTVIESSG